MGSSLLFLPKMKLVLFGISAISAVVLSKSPVKTSKNIPEIKVREKHVPQPIKNRNKRSATRELTDSERSALLDAHNNWRAKAARGELTDSVKARKMETMYWDKELENHSKEYSKLCIWDHSQPQGFDQLGYSYGENLYITSRLNIDNLEQAVDSWATEHLDYNHFTGECVAGKMCGHYTQVVWEDTTRVGCAITECESVQGISFGGSLIVCQYYTSGNYYGELPYHSGETAESCDSYNNDYAGLCGNENSICENENRCRAVETCVPSDSLANEFTAYTCEQSESSMNCEFTQISGFEIDWPYDNYNGMADSDGNWKYCYGDLSECQDWCLLEKHNGCLGVTESSQNPGFYFPVKSFDEKSENANASYWELKCGGEEEGNDVQEEAQLVYGNCDDIPCSHACFMDGSIPKCACPRGYGLVSSEFNCERATC